MINHNIHTIYDKDLKRKTQTLQIPLKLPKHKS